MSREIGLRERIVAALRAGPATNAELQTLIGAAVGTIRNNLSQLMQEGLVVEDGGKPKTYSLVSSSLPTAIGDDSDDTSETGYQEEF